MDDPLVFDGNPNLSSTRQRKPELFFEQLFANLCEIGFKKQSYKKSLLFLYSEFSSSFNCDKTKTVLLQLEYTVKLGYNEHSVITNTRL
jgi:hypothetical protein